MEIILRPLAKIHTDMQLKVLDIRNEDDVRKWMYIDTPIGVNEHLQWLKKIKEDNTQLVFAVMLEGQAIGIVKATRIDHLHKSADWAFFLSSQGAPQGLGAALEFHFLDFVFGKLNIEKLNCEVIEGNDRVLKLHAKFLFADEGFRTGNIIKNGQRIGVHLLGLTRNAWQEGRDKLLEKYGKSFSRFRISIDWSDSDLSSSDRHPLDEIESARARNNLNWMSILRLVLDLAPEQGALLVSDIRKIDKEIGELTDKLIEKKRP